MSLPAPALYSPGRQGVVPLRPLQAGEMLDGAVTAMREHPGVMLGMSAIVVAFGQLLAIPMDFFYLRYLAGLVDSSTTSGGSRGIIDLASFRPSTLINILTVAMLVGLLSTTVSRSVLGRPAPLGEVWAATRPRVLRLLGLVGLIYLVFFGSIALAVTPGILILAGGDSAGGWLVFLGAVGGGFFALNRWVAWLLAPAVLVLEDQTVGKSLKRSALLVKGGWWRTLGIWLLAVLVANLVAGVLAFGEQYLLGSQLSPVTKYTDGTYSGHQVTWLSIFLSAALGTALQSLVSPFAASVTALQYVDRRMRREGLDIQLARSARNAGGNGSGNGNNTGLGTPTAGGPSPDQPRTAL